MRRLLCAPFLLAAMTGSPSASAQAASDAMAETLYNNALDLMEAGKNVEACPLLEQSQEIDPAVGTLLYLGLCYERTGRTASAWATYRAAGEAGRRGNQAERSKIALENASRIEPSLSRVTIVMPQASSGVSVFLDGEPIGAVALGMAMPVDPGSHVVEARAPNSHPVQIRLEVKTGEAHQTVNIPPLQPLAASGTATPVASGTTTPPDTYGETRDAQTPQALTGLGAVVGADIDGKFRGVVATVGMTYRLAEAFELQATALVGRDRGAQPGASLYITGGVVKPTIHVGVPVFLTDGVRPGAHASVGLRVDPTDRFGLYARGGLTAFASVPEGYDETVAVLSAGAMGQF